MKVQIIAAIVAVVVVVVLAVGFALKRLREIDKESEEKAAAIKYRDTLAELFPDLEELDFFNAWWRPKQGKCERKCKALFNGQSKISYEDACVSACRAGQGMSAAQRCEYCGSKETPMSGFNEACQKYIGVSDDDWNGGSYSSACCGLGEMAQYKRHC